MTIDNDERHIASIKYYLDLMIDATARAAKEGLDVQIKTFVTDYEGIIPVTTALPPSKWKLKAVRIYV